MNRQSKIGLRIDVSGPLNFYTSIKDLNYLSNNQIKDIIDIIDELGNCYDALKDSREKEKFDLVSEYTKVVLKNNLKSDRPQFTCSQEELNHLFYKRCFNNHDINRINQIFFQIDNLKIFEELELLESLLFNSEQKCVSLLLSAVNKKNKKLIEFLTCLAQKREFTCFRNSFACLKMEDCCRIYCEDNDYNSGNLLLYVYKTLINCENELSRNVLFSIFDIQRQVIKSEPLFLLSKINLWSIETFEVFKKIIDLGYPIDEITVKQAFLLQDYKIINTLLNNIEKEKRSRFFEVIIDSLNELDDANLESILLNTCPDIKDKFTCENLFNAIASETKWFSLYIIDNCQPEIILKNYDKLLHLAIEKSNLRIIRLLNEKAIKLGITNIHYSELIELDKIGKYEDFEKRIFTFALHSPSPEDEIFLLLKNKKIQEQWSNCLTEVLRQISLVVRLPRPHYRDAIKGEYDDESYKYSKKNDVFINKLLSDSNFKNLSRNAVLELISKDRYTRFTEDNSTKENYILKTSKAVMLTPVDSRVNKAFCFKNLNDELITNNIQQLSTALTRYGFSTRFVNDIRLDISKPYVHFVYSFPDLNSQESINIPMTYFGWHPIRNCLVWQHNLWTEDKNSEKLEKRVEHLYSALINFDFNLGTKEAFDDLLSEYYWVESTMCTMKRGTPHNAMMLLNIILRYHHLKPLIPSFNNFFLDNRMLMTHLATVKKNWKTYFEQSLKFRHFVV